MAENGITKIAAEFAEDNNRYKFMWKEGEEYHYVLSPNTNMENYMKQIDRPSGHNHWIPAEFLVTTRITDMKRAFGSGDGGCNVNGVQICWTEEMFEGHDLSSWDVSNVTNMDRMFERAEKHDRSGSIVQDLSYWDVSNVTIWRVCF